MQIVVNKRNINWEAQGEKQWKADVINGIGMKYIGAHWREGRGRWLDYRLHDKEALPVESDYQALANNMKKTSCSMGMI